MATIRPLQLHPLHTHLQLYMTKYPVGLFLPIPFDSSGTDRKGGKMNWLYYLVTILDITIDGWMHVRGKHCPSMGISFYFRKLFLDYNLLPNISSIAVKHIRAKIFQCKTLQIDLNRTIFRQKPQMSICCYCCCCCFDFYLQQLFDCVS